LKRVIISVTNDLVTDQRIHKVASTFMKAGYVPVLVGRLLKNSLIIERPYPAVRMKLIFKKGPFFYLEYNIRLFFFLLFTKATIFLSNDLDTLPANYLAAVIKKKKLIYDSHELFTEVPELVNRPSAKQFWSTIESWILPRIRLAMTVSQSISDFYQQKYGIKMAVVRNLPVEKQKIQSGQNPFNEFLPKKIIIYQGALNMARGIEQVIEAMQFIENAMFVIVGEGDITNQLKEQTVKLKLNKKIIFLGKI
jgi:glycosyltransferase involved in cell wall biosynthesis